MKEKTVKAVAVIEEGQDKGSVDSFITLALSNNAPIETLERLFALHKEVEAEKAKSAYVQALANFQKDCPVVEKTKKVMNKDGRTVRYLYAPLDTIVAQIKKPLGDAGMSYTWTVEQDAKGMTATAKITHIQGHSETSSFTVPIVASDFMTSPQSNASAQTFAKRYALCNALGISTGDEDTDATDVNKEKSPVSPKAKIMLLLRRLGVETNDAVVIKEKVQTITQLELKEENFVEIVNRLELSVREKEEYDTSTDI